MLITVRLFARLRELAGASELPRELPEGSIVLVNLSGRGDKDVQSVAEALQ